MHHSNGACLLLVFGAVYSCTILYAQQIHFFSAYIQQSQAWFFTVLLLSDLPGNQLTADDLGCVLREVLDVSADWYDLGLELKVRVGTLDNIRTDFTAAKHQLREMLKAWLTTGDYPSWKTLIDALRSPVVGASQMAAALEMKYCPGEGTELDVGGHPETVFPSSPVLPTVMSQQTDMQESMRK